MALKLHQSTLAAIVLIFMLVFEALAISNDKGAEVVGLILARKGSKGIPGKNMVLLNGHPLISWSLMAMTKSKAFKSIWVSTDDDILASWVSNNFDNVYIHRRPAYTATDEASSLISVQEFLSVHKDVKILGLVQATSPFIRAEYLTAARVLLSKHHSVFSVTLSHSLRWSAKHPIKPLNFDPKLRPRRQDWPGEFIENGMFYFTNASNVVERGILQDDRPGLIEIPKEDSLEVDTIVDLSVAEVLMKARKISHDEL